MHELSLVQNLLQQLHELAEEHRKTRVLTVYMCIGPFSGVVIDSFEFGFETLAKESQLTSEAVLIIENPDAGYRCCGCNTVIKHKHKQKTDQCPNCSETLLIPEGGDELILSRVEME